MLAVLRHELKMNYKGLLLWSVIVGGMGLFCILLFDSMKDSMDKMAESFATMGTFSDVLGLNVLSIATLKGYFATEIGIMHGLGGGMFAASLATILLSKEEDGHTAEYLFSLPVSREKVIIIKIISLVIDLMAFQAICAALYGIGFAILGEQIPGKEFFLFIGAGLLMNIEIGAICFAISACNRTNKLGIGLGVTLLFYAFDLISRAVPAMEDYLGIGPFSYSNATQIFTEEKLATTGAVIGCIVAIAGFAAGSIIYKKRDLVC